ncbi:ribonuclease E inhibitor RraB [Stutzerimonas tarimensis]|uniref:Ribonuclease E inhibitor RraB n=1 Tax=Stutzerimonas tarimensis TaxID=1507735 RepID=A0ABV7TBF0_9GAMM
MATTLTDDVSSTVLRRMKEGGFDFARAHPIDFYAILPDEDCAREAASQFRGESTNAQVFPREEGGWNLQVSKIMYATYNGIGEFEHDLEELVEPLGGVIDGWGVTQELAGDF